MDVFEVQCNCSAWFFTQNHQPVQKLQKDWYLYGSWNAQLLESTSFFHFKTWTWNFFFTLEKVKHFGNFIGVGEIVEWLLFNSISLSTTLGRVSVGKGKETAARLTNRFDSYLQRTVCTDNVLSTWMVLNLGSNKSITFVLLKREGHFLAVSPKRIRYEKELCLLSYALEEVPLGIALPDWWCTFYSADCNFIWFLFASLFSFSISWKYQQCPLSKQTK